MRNLGRKLQAKWEKCKTLYCLRSGLMHQSSNQSNDNGRSKGGGRKPNKKEIEQASDQRTRRLLSPHKDKQHHKQTQRNTTHNRINKGDHPVNYTILSVDFTGRSCTIEAADGRRSNTFRFSRASAETCCSFTCGSSNFFVSFFAAVST